MDGMSALRRETPESSLAPPANQDDTHTARRGQTAAQKKVLTRPHPTGSLILPFWPLELWKVNFCCLQAPLPGALGYTFTTISSAPSSVLTAWNVLPRGLSRAGSSELRIQFIGPLGAPTLPSRYRCLCSVPRATGELLRARKRAQEQDQLAPGSRTPSLRTGKNKCLLCQPSVCDVCHGSLS